MQAKVCISSRFTLLMLTAVNVAQEHPLTPIGARVVIFWPQTAYFREFLAALQRVAVFLVRYMNETGNRD
jgi:hypothetical protein